MIRGVLLDSGDTLIGPRGGRWNPRFDFEDVIARHRVDVPAAALAGAFAAGQAFLDEVDGTPSRDRYHEVILRRLGLEPTVELLAELDRPLPGELLMDVFDDVRPALDQIRDLGVRMVVVSDNWATLPDMYRSLGLADHVEGFVISEVLGCTKPDPRMYLAGSELLGLDPPDCAFVDDDPLLVDAAIDLGFDGYVIDRSGSPAPGDRPVLTSLTELPDRIRPGRRWGDDPARRG